MFSKIWLTASFYSFSPLRGIFSLPVQQWRLHRKLIQPSFNLSILQSFVPLFDQKVNIMIRNLGAKVDKREAFDIYRFTARCTLDMVCEKKALKEFRRPAKEILLRKSSSEDHDDIKSTQQLSFNSLVEQLYSTFRRIGRANLEVIENEINSVIFAGTETSASTVANTLLLLAMHQDVQEKVVAEIRQHFGDDEENIRYEILQKLVYLEMVVKESLRLLPVASILGRNTSQEIAVGKHLLPAGVDVAIDVYNIHRNPTYWGADADQFRPERFSTNDYNRFAFLPFSAGSRNCIGLRYSMLSMKTMLTKILATYRVETDLQLKDLNMKIAFTLKITNGHMVRLTRR
ncbi:cytochrome P450 4g15-like [Anopheles darlingi]|uniref:cytochrome P450 4g15-like n=1 Tax=Anopheles darlingi TaxID=43151 RepID=UPI0021000E9F|nr:cytochrome P450 4g15-like [Anopheles darlingi]